MRVMTIDEMPANPTPLGGASRLLVSKPELRVVNLILQPGEKVTEHDAPVEVIFIIRAGHGTINIDDSSFDFREGEMLICPPDCKRSLDAGDGGADILVIRAPNL